MLETKIEELTKAIIELTQLLNEPPKAVAPVSKNEKSQTEPQHEKETVAPSTEAKEPVDNDTENTMTYSDLEALFLATVRKDRKFKPMLSEILTNAGVKVLSELDKSQYEAVYSAVKALS